MKPIPAILIALCLGCGVARSRAAETIATPTDIPAIIAQQTLVFTSPAKQVPSRKMVDGPLLGNGDVGVVVAGTPDQLRFYIGKNDFWGMRTRAPMAVGQLRISVPSLTDATFHEEVDIQNAEFRGAFANASTSLATRAWVDANANRLFIELTNRGREPFPIAVRTIEGAGASMLVPAQVTDTAAPTLEGCEQHGGGRWYFDGEIADLLVADKALSPAEVTALAKSPRKETESFDGTRSHLLPAPPIKAALTISGWIKASSLSPEADYIVSKGDWNQAYSLGISHGHIRFSIGNTYLECHDAVALNEWRHIAAVYDGTSISLYLDGQPKESIGAIANQGGDFLYDPDGMPTSRKVAVSTRLLRVQSAGANTERFDLAPGQTATIASIILSDLDATNPLAQTKKEISELTLPGIADMQAKHRQWWRDYWNRSFIEIPDKTLEQEWYVSQYVMGSCSRSGKVAPGLWGNWITADNTDWHGDYHLNYNFQAPYYGVFAANHTEVALPFFKAINDYIPAGQKIASAHGWKGVHFGVGIGPWGTTTDSPDWGQRSDAAFCALNYISYYQSTRDVQFLKETAYPFLREVADFWEDYLKFEDGRYVIYNDSIHEGSGADMNPLLSLGLVRTLFKNMVPMSQDLSLDEDRRAKWSDISARISAFPTQQRGGKTVFRYSEKGTAWWPDNTLGVHHIFPACAIGLDSDPRLLEISRNTIDAMNRWNDNNGSSSWYTACARVGYDPVSILTHMHQMCDKHLMPNKVLYFGGGGIENVSPFHAITEMLFQSHEGVLRFFPCWPKDQDARFGNLRAYGAFLVSAEKKGATVDDVKIFSEKGCDCTVQNPWPGKAVQLTRDGTPSETFNSDRFTIKTKAGETLGLGSK